MKGIILAAGKGTRLYPATIPVCKPLITVYDKPLIYYPLSLLIMAGIKDVMIIVPPGDMEPVIRLLDDGEELGINIYYKEQKVQRGIADAFLVAKRFIGNDTVCLALGDNIFYSASVAPGKADAGRMTFDGDIAALKGIEETGEACRLKTGAARMFRPCSLRKKEECPYHCRVSLSAGREAGLIWLTGRGDAGTVSVFFESRKSAHSLMVPPSPVLMGVGTRLMNLSSLKCGEAAKRRISSSSGRAPNFS